MPIAGTKNDLSVEEIISTLKRSSLPTVVVEGSDDIVVHRRLEERLTHLGVSVLPVGGRDKVIAAFERRDELPARLKIVFIADQDTWVYSSIPSAYNHPNIIFTNGYSIENDVFLDGNLLALLSAHDAHIFRQELGQFVDWYAVALARHLVDCRNPIALHPEQVLDPARLPTLTALQPAESFPTSLRNQLLGDFGRLLRGKSLMGLLLRCTNRRPGQPRHTSTGLMEMVAINPGPNLQRVSQFVEARLSA
jgi:hypothetical protein